MNYPYDPRLGNPAAAAGSAGPPLPPMHPAWINNPMQNPYINQQPMQPYPGQMYAPPPPGAMYASQAGAAALYSWPPPQGPPPMMHPHPINPNSWGGNPMHPALPLIPPILPSSSGTSAEPSSTSSSTVKPPFHDSFYTAPFSMHGIATSTTTTAKHVDATDAAGMNGTSASDAASLNAARRKSHDSGSSGTKRKAVSSSDSSNAEDAHPNTKDKDQHVTVKEEEGVSTKKRKSDTVSSSAHKTKALEADAADAAALKRLLSKQDEQADEPDEMFDDSLSSDSDADDTRLRGGAASGSAEVDNISPAAASQDSNATSANSPLSAVKPTTQSAAALAAQNRQRGVIVAANGGIVHLGTGAPLLPIDPTPDSALARYQQHMNNFGNNPYYNDKIIAPSHRNARRIGADRRRRAKLKEALNLLRDIIMKHGQDATNFDQVSVLYASVDLMHTFENMIQQQQSCILQAEKVKKDLQHKVESLNKQVAAAASSFSSAAAPTATASSSSSSTTTPPAAAATKEASRSDAATAN